MLPATEPRGIARRRPDLRPNRKVTGVSDKRTITFGSLLRRKREELALSQREFAKRVGVKATYVAYLENGRRRPSLSLLKRIADVLGADPKKLLLLSHPEAKELLSPPPKARRHPPRSELWRNFADHHRLIKRNKITSAELKILKQVCISLNVSSPRSLIFILTAIRIAIEPDQEQ